MFSFVGAANSGAENVLTNIEISETRSSTAEYQSMEALNAANSLKTLIETGGATTEEILDYVNSIIYSATSANEESQNSRIAATSAKSIIYSSVFPNLRSLNDYLENSGYVEDQLDSMSLNIGLMNTTISSIQNQISLIEDESDSISSDIDSKLNGTDGIANHVANLFSDDCLSNYVQVPILSLDLDGKYVAPSIGLKNALQTELNRIKEVTQVVEVVDGSTSLVPADISVNGTVVSSYVPSAVESQVRAVILGILKRRDFNSPLYLDSLYDVVKQIPGIDYVNIEITGPSAFLTGGNLVPEENQVIVYGSLTINLLQG
jgi:hypothetical protein